MSFCAIVAIAYIYISSLMHRLSCEIGTVIIPILHLRKLRCGEVCDLQQVTEGQDYQPGSRAPEPRLSTASLCHFSLQMAAYGNSIHDGEKQEKT